MQKKRHQNRTKCSIAIKQPSIKHGTRQTRPKVKYKHYWNFEAENWIRVCQNSKIERRVQNTGQKLHFAKVEVAYL